MVFGIGGVAGVRPVASERKVHIAIELGSPLTAAQVSQALLRIFTSDNIMKRFSEYWKPLMDMDADRAQFRKDHPDGGMATLDGTHTVYCCVMPQQVIPPKVIHAPDPEYPGDSESQRMEGKVILDLVIDEDGFPSIIKVKHSLRESLDVQAAEAVSNWKFHPATKDGKPVAAMVNVEVNFRP